MQKHTILIFGAGGRTGKEHVTAALEAGHTVSAFVRNQPEHSVLPLHEKLTFITGDARNYNNVLSALSSHDVVINVIAPRMGDQANYDISYVATRNIVQGMKELGMTRYIGQAGAWGTEHLEDASLPMRVAFSVLPSFKAIYAYKKLEDAEVKQSGLTWTLVRCGLLTDKPQAPVKVSMQRRKCGFFEIPKISRKSVAAFELSIVDNEAFYLRTPIIVN